jgi:hypothetical protein
LALRLCTALGDTPDVRRRVAAAVGVTERTLRRWAQRRRAGEPLARPRGRRPTPVARHRRQAVIGALLRLGPCAGVPVLRGLFRDVPYRTLAKLKRRFARALRRRRGWYRQRLRWRRAGGAWATDFTHPAARLPGTSHRLCLVRDLASGAQLAATPCRGERARVVGAVLAALFVALGPPLVLKHDGGGAFRAHATTALLREHSVVPLRSPPRTPQYNGACERSGGTFKQRVAYVASAPRGGTGAGQPHRTPARRERTDARRGLRQTPADRRTRATSIQAHSRARDRACAEDTRIETRYDAVVHRARRHRPQGNTAGAVQTWLSGVSERATINTGFDLARGR